MSDDEDWGITADYKNVMNEMEQRFGVQGVPGRVGHLDMDRLRQSVLRSDAESKKNSIPSAAYGYGGKFGVEKDRMDKSAVGSDYQSETQKHSSQTDYSQGFGGSYGVQSDRQDKNAVGYGHHEELSKHSSQKDYSMGFGGKYGVQKDRIDASALGYKDTPERPAPHQSQSRPEVNVGENRAKELRDRFEKLALDRNTPAERPPRPQVGRLNLNIFMRPRVEEELLQPEAKTAGEEVTQNNVMEGLKVASISKSWPPKPPSTEPEPKREPTPVNTTHKYEPPPRERTPEAEKPPSEWKPCSPEPPSPSPEARPESDEDDWEVPKFPKFSDSPPKPPEPEQPSSITAAAAFDFTASEDGELSLKAGDTIVNINKFDSSWWFGHVGARSGIFPANHVEEIKSVGDVAPVADTTTCPTRNITAMALYDFVASHADELSFTAGDEIVDVSKFDNLWWSGRIGDRFGIFPANYVSEN